MKPVINTSNSTFEKFRQGGLLYVDKTAHLERLIRPSQAQYFLARPRRFGKSLLISTLKAIFEAKRELFKDLAIDTMDWSWSSHLVVHLNMGSCAGRDLADTELRLQDLLDSSAAGFGIQLCKSGASRRFTELIQALAARGSVVVLVDEYDKPLLAHLGQGSAREIQTLLKDFYGVIKTCEERIRFAFITGISKFSKVSIFSDLKNLTDLSMSRDGAALLGYTQEELESNFSEYMSDLAGKLNWDIDRVSSELKRWYNGYCFHGEGPSVYNPVSVMKCLAEQEIKNYWFETAAPTFLVDLLKAQPVIPEDLTIPETSLSAYEPEHLQLLPLLVQTGYLTLKNLLLMGEDRFHELGYPNLEVERSFSKVLLKHMAELNDSDMGSGLRKIYKALQEGDVDALMTQISIFFKGIPYNIQLKNEKYYQSLFVSLFRILGAYVQAEVCTADGRVDAVLRSANQMLVLEFKLHGSAQSALDQIRSKDYGLAWTNEAVDVVLVGVGFDAETRNIGEWLVEYV